jgi:hypothetical protein
MTGIDGHPADGIDGLMGWGGAEQREWFHDGSGKVEAEGGGPPPDILPEAINDRV